MNNDPRSFRFSRFESCAVPVEQITHLLCATIHALSDKPALRIGDIVKCITGMCGVGAGHYAKIVSTVEGRGLGVQFSAHNLPATYGANELHNCHGSGAWRRCRYGAKDAEVELVFRG